MLHSEHRFTSDQKEQFAGVSGVTITTYTMVSFSGRRSEESQKVSRPNHPHVIGPVEATVLSIPCVKLAAKRKLCLQKVGVPCRHFA